MIAMASYPVMSDLFNVNRAKFRKSHRRLLTLVIVLGVGVSLLWMVFGNWGTTAMLGRRYSESMPLFKMLIWLLPISLIRYIYGISLFAAGMQKAHSFSSLFGSLSMISVGTILVYKYGAMGAVFSSLLSELVVLLTMFLFFESRLKTNEA